MIWQTAHHVEFEDCKTAFMAARYHLNLINEALLSMEQECEILCESIQVRDY